MKILGITGSRADYDRLKPVFLELQKRNGCELSIAALGPHFSKRSGLTYREIQKDGFKINIKIKNLLEPTSKVNTSKTVAGGLVKLSDALEDLAPDAVLCLGDRFELLSIAVACTCQMIPLVHLCGGEVTRGALDEQVRHMLTKASHLHCAANKVFANRILQMGEERWRVCVSGSPSVDSIKNTHFVSRAELEKFLKIDLSKPTALVTLHPATLENLSFKTQVLTLISALKKENLQYVITYPNSDPGSEVILEMFKKFALSRQSSVRLVPNLGGLRYLSLMRFICILIGNSSSAVVEAPSLGIPAVNIGNRQEGRVFAKNIIHSKYNINEIRGAIRKALNQNASKIKNPYGDGRSAKKIVDFMLSSLQEKTKTEILSKRFIDSRDVA